MTQGELINYLNGLIGKNDAVTNARIVTFSDRWYKFIWQKYLWNETIIYVTTTYPSGSTTLSLPSTVDSVLALAANNQPIQNKSMQTIVSQKPHQLDITGAPIAYTNEPKDSSGFAVIRLIPTPSQDFTIKLACKKVFTSLVDNNDSPKIRGVDDAWIELTMIDLLWREREPAFASERQALATIMLDKMYEMETNQQEKNIQITPGYNDLYWADQKSCGNSQNVYSQ